MYIIIGADGREYGPVSADQLRQWIAEGRANGQSKVRLEGNPEGKPLREFSEFASLFAIAQPAPAKTLPKTNQMATAGLVLGILSLTAGCCCYGLPFNVVGIVCSVVALSEISKDPLHQQGKGLAIAGLVLSLLSILMAILLLAFSFSGTDLFRKLNRH